MLEWLKDAFDYIVIGTIYDIIKECKRNPVYRLQVTLAHIALLRLQRVRGRGAPRV